MAEQPRPLDTAVARLVDAAPETRPGTPPAPARGQAEDPLVAAVDLAATDLGVFARAPDPRIDTGLAPLDAILVASGLMGWRVGLVHRWWTAVASPLIASDQAGPVAIRPCGDRPVLARPGGPARRLDRRTARSIESPGVAVAGELPADPRWWHLLAWSLQRRRADAWTLVVLGVIGGLAGLLLPLATAIIFESAVPAGHTKRIAVVLIAFGVASIGASILVQARGVLVVRLRDQSDEVLSTAVVARALRLPAAFFRTRTTGDVVDRILSVDAARQQVDDGMIAALVTAAFGLANLCYLLAADLAVGLVSALVTAIVLALSVRVQLRVRGALSPLLEGRSRTDATLLGLLGSAVSWRVAAAEDRALARWAVDQGRSTSALRAMLARVGLTGPLDVAGPMAVTLGFVLAVILMPGAHLQPGSTSAPGAFLALYAAVIQLTLAMMVLGQQLVSICEVGPVLSRLAPLVTTPTERPSEPVAGSQAPADADPGPLSGAISMRDVVFGYVPDRPPLITGLSLAVRAGEFLAVVGPSGGGKSTVLRLLLGFETPWEGAVCFDDRELARLDPIAVRRQLGVVLQASRPLGRTVRECVAGARLLGDDEVWGLLEHAGLADDVQRMPHGLATPVGDHGLLLSGGQRQRLMIASALAGNPRVLLLDEATSALDTVTQEVVMRTVLGSTATRIVVAHRMSTIRGADRVVVVAGGRIVEEGTPADLRAAGGHFTRLAARQEL